MKKWFKKLSLWPRTTAEPQPSVSPTPAPREPVVQTVPVYPPVDEGIGAASVDQILSSTPIKAILERIRVASSMRQAEYDELVVAAIRNYVSYVNLLPATEHHHHKGAGGLATYGLSLAFYSLQACNGVIFSSAESVERRRANEHRWCYATFLAALCSELHAPLTQLTVVLETGEEWPSFQIALTDWLESKGASRYWIRWLDKPVSEDFTRRGTGAYVLPQILPSAAMDYLKAGGGNIVTSMLSVITGDIKPGERFPMWDVVDDVRARVIERDIGLSPSLYGKLTVGTHIEPSILDAIRTLVRSSKWRVNERKSRLWYRTDGLYLVWGSGTHSELYEAMGDVKGMPKSEGTILEVLMNGGIIMPASDGGPFWDIENEKSKLRCIRFSNPDAIFTEENDAPAPIVVAKQRSATSPIPASPAKEDTSQGALELVDRAPIVPGDLDTPPPSVARADGEDAEELPPVETPPAATLSRPAKKEAGAKLPASPKTNQPSSAASADLSQVSISSLDKEAAMVMGCLLEDIQAKKNRASMAYWSCELGFAVSLETMQSYGVDSTLVLNQLASQAWLILDADKAGRKIHSLPYQGKNTNAVVFNVQVARAIGLVS